MAEKISGIEAKLEQIENGMLEIQNALAEKMSGIEAKLEKQNENRSQDNHKEPSLMKNNSTLAVFHLPLPIYRWDASDCHPKIVINESTNAIRRNATGTDEFRGGNINGIPFSRSCRARPIQMPSAAGRIGIIYTEYRILAGKGALWHDSNHKCHGNETTIWDLPYFDTGDNVGCGLNWATGQVFFTKNGQRLNITNLYVDEDTADLYPTVTLSSHGDAVEANFGPNFKYDLSKKF
ncbi:hypothetical protein niasHT_026136 [Heterodera trifolii]|uniref:B30.2/SPRY domain-containing protein n=1 Tax=Heterodera trifolii TaxID=157864 RepID=A0ABD2JZW6_9BILA